MKLIFKKMTTLATVGVIMSNMVMNVYASNQLVEIDLWNAVSDQASMGNVATDNNEVSLYDADSNKIYMALNPVNISGYISGVTTILVDTTGNGDFKEVNVSERGTIESGTKNNGVNHVVEYIKVMDFDVPSHLTKTGVEYIDIKMSVPHTPMDGVIGDGHLDARLKIDWNTVQTTDMTQIVADDTISGGEVSSVLLQDKTSGVKVIGDTSQVQYNAGLYVEKITSGTSYNKAKATLETDDFDLYDIRLGVDGEDVGLLAAAEIRIPYAGELTTYRISEDGKKTLLRGSVVVNEYSFLTNQLGLIAVVGGDKKEISLIEGATDNGGLNTNKETENPFTDIGSHWAKDNILYAVQHGLFSGVTPTTFAPESNMTGAMVVTVLYNMSGKPDVSTDDSAWYGKAVAWAENNNIIGSYNDFDPQRDVTREEFATMLYKFEQSKNTTVAGADLSKFSDKGEISDWAYEGLSWTNAVGIVNGTTTTTIAPKNSATRAVIATMLCNYIDMK